MVGSTEKLKLFDNVESVNNIKPSSFSTRILYNYVRVNYHHHEISFPLKTKNKYIKNGIYNFTCLFDMIFNLLFDI
jgi:hypothetical protein